MHAKIPIIAFCLFPNPMSPIYIVTCRSLVQQALAICIVKPFYYLFKRNRHKPGLTFNCKNVQLISLNRRIVGCLKTGPDENSVVSRNLGLVLIQEVLARPANGNRQGFNAVLPFLAQALVCLSGN